jgi:uncharacterized protein YerC
MPLRKILFKSGVNKENTRYTNENGWYISEKVRFRQGTPEKIGGWQRISGQSFLGICRSLWNWVTLSFDNLLAVGTNLKFYIERGGNYYDITPIRETATLTNPFSTTINQTTVVVTDNTHGAATGDFVTFSGASAVGGLTLNGNYQITVTGTNTYTITASAQASSTATGGGTVTAKYEIPVGPAIQGAVTGWGAGGWGMGTWGFGVTGTEALRLWVSQNWGEDLVFAYRSGPIYYWDATNGVTTRGVALNTIGGTCSFTATSPTTVTFDETILSENTAVKFAATSSMPSGVTAGTTYYLRNVIGASANISASPTGALVNAASTGSGVYISDLVDVPSAVNTMIVSDTFRFLLAFGTTEYGSSTLDPMLIRWSNQESLTDWVPASANQAGSLRLSHGSKIVTVVQTRQEIVVFTDASLYSLQYLGPPLVWGTQLLGDNISIIAPNAAIVASGIVYWMGVDKFYKYDGRVQTMRCDLRRHIFSNINPSQVDQVFAGTNEGFNEVWWFYPSRNSTVIDQYVVYNYAEDIWYYGTMGRTAWSDSGLRAYPQAATYVNNIVNHELGWDDQSSETPVAINAYIESSEFDIEDGQKLGFVYRVVPDITFDNSTVESPQVTMTLIPMMNSGSGYNTPQSEGGSSSATVARLSTTTIERFTGQVYVRVRGRQMIFKVESTDLGNAWQLGSPRIDIRPDGSATGRGA